MLKSSYFCVQICEFSKILDHGHEIYILVGSVMTPYYSEETVFSKNDLDLENEDGVSIIFYLQKIYPGYNLCYFSEYNAV